MSRVKSKEKARSKRNSKAKSEKKSSAKKVALPKISWSNLGYLSLGCLTLFAFYVLLLFVLTPSVDGLMSESSDRPSSIVSADGIELASLRRSNKHWIPLEEISPYVVDALISTEDHRFFDHNGVDIRRTLSSIYHTAIGDRQGGSTIPQQLARIAFPKRVGKSISINRKLKEAVTAVKIESTYSKEQILEIYLNYIPFIYQATGIEMGARTYFNKSASDLNLLESATLVGVLKGTSYYNPKQHPKRSKERRNIVLAQMAKRGHVQEAALGLLQKRPLRLRFRRQNISSSRASHFVRRVQTDAMTWAEENGFDLYRDGLTIETTMDSRLQEHANYASQKWMPALQAVVDVEWSARNNVFLSTKTTPYQEKVASANRFKYFWEKNPELLERLIKKSRRFQKRGKINEAEALELLSGDKRFMDSLKVSASRLQLGFVAIEPRTGAVKAWVGSRNYKSDQYDHVAMAKRQVGSIFKPFVYAEALRRGYQPYYRYDEGEINRDYRFIQANSEDESRTLAQALAKSDNEVTEFLMEEVGPTSAAYLAKKMGVRKSELREVASLALGTSEASLLEMVSAYSTIASGGQYRAPYWIKSIKSHGDEFLFRHRVESEEALDQGVSEQLTDMMRGVVDYGTGSDVRNRFGLTQDLAGKTGTTQNNADGWYLQMHPNLVAGSWVGFNEPSVHFRSDYWGAGGHNALRIVADFYKQGFSKRSIKAARFSDPEILIRDREGRTRGFRKFLRDVFGSNEVKIETDDLKRVDIAKASILPELLKNTKLSPRERRVLMESLQKDLRSLDQQIRRSKGQLRRKLRSQRRELTRLYRELK